MKPKKLFPYEYEIIKIHTLIGEDIVKETIKDFSWMKAVRPIVRNHHERWDGKGYPDGLQGEEIPLKVRIVTIADAFDAMTHDRPYRRALSLEEALEELRRNRGSQFDPEVVDIAIKVLEQEYDSIKVF
jgi:polar amino acid transport system substrate-binding protein